MLKRDCEIFGNLASENLRFNLYCCSYLLVWSGRASCALQTALSCSTPGTWHHCPRVLCHHGQCSTEALSSTDAYLFNTEHLVIWISKIHVKMFDSCTELPIHEYFLTDWNNKASTAVPPCPSLRPCDRVISPPYSDLTLTTRGGDTLAMSGSLSSRRLASCSRVLWIIAFW